MNWKAPLYHCAGPSCPGYSYKASDRAHPPSCAKDPRLPLRAIVEDFEKLRGAPLSLEEKLRLSVAENDANKRKVAMQTDEEIQKAIEERRASLYSELNEALAARDAAEARVKKARKAIADAPRLHVPRKYPGRRKSMSSELEAKLATGELTEPLTDITGCDV